MGIRSIERRLAAELCYEAVTRVVRDYLAACQEAGRYLPHYEHLVVPIIRAGYYPPGLLGVGHFISRQEKTARAAAKHAGVEGREISLVDEDALIAELMAPYPTARLRARRHREAKRQFAEAQREQWRRQDATKCDTLQQNAIVSASAPSETEDGRGADQTSRANANGDDPDPLTAAVPRGGNDNRPVPGTGSVTESHSEPAGQGGDAAKCNTTVAGAGSNWVPGAIGFRFN